MPWHHLCHAFLWQPARILLVASRPTKCNKQLYRVTSLHMGNGWVGPYTPVYVQLRKGISRIFGRMAIIDNIFPFNSDLEKGHLKVLGVDARVPRKLQAAGWGCGLPAILSILKATRCDCKPKVK